MPTTYIFIQKYEKYSKLIPKLSIEPVHNKTYNKTCVTSKDSDQPVHLPSIAVVLVYPSLDSREAVEGTCDQQRL